MKGHQRPHIVILGADAYIVKANLDPHNLNAEVERILHAPIARQVE